MTLMNPEPASTLLLLKDINSSIEVFMIKRASKTNFGGTWVFPGGKIDQEDLDIDIPVFCQGLDDKKASNILNIESNGLSYWVACLRECFEESGVLLAYRQDGSDFNPDAEESDILDTLRADLNSGKTSFEGILMKFNLRLAVDKLIYLSHWITPNMEVRRYSTRFFIASIANDQKAIHDGYEAVDSLWVKIEQGLEEYNQGNFPIIMPTIKNLELLSGYESTLSLINDKKMIEPKDIPPIEPKFFIEDGKLVGLLPGDNGYEDH
tara:strand:- start:229 stop:1023 length:795 start_codon:yes stop_codon:yes gene_type:complete